MQESLFEAIEIESSAGKKLLEIIEKSVHAYGLKQFSYLIKKEPAQLRDAFNQNGKYFSLTWLPIILRRNTEGATEFINFLCDILDKKHPENKEEFTPEEKLKIYEEKIKQHGLELLFK